MLPTSEPLYVTAFKNFAITRTPSGVLTLRLHTEGGTSSSPPIPSSSPISRI